MFRDDDTVIDKHKQERGIVDVGMLVGNVFHEADQWFLKGDGEEKRSQGVALLDTGDVIESNLACPY